MFALVSFFVKNPHTLSHLLIIKLTNDVAKTMDFSIELTREFS